MYEFIINTNSITVTVSNCDQSNPNKINAPYTAQELWAVTTMYETPGFETEKVKLTNTGSGIWTGYLQVTDNDPRTVIIFDDVFTKPHPYGGTDYPAPSNPPLAGSGGHYIITTDDYFSPCGGKTVDGISLADELLFSTQSSGISTPYIPSPRLPLLGDLLAGPPSLVNAVNDEVYTLYYNISPGEQIEVDYTALSQTSVNNFCECNKIINIRARNGSVSVLQSPYSTTGNFTDNDFDQASGLCGPRMP